MRVLRVVVVEGADDLQRVQRPEDRAVLVGDVGEIDHEVDRPIDFVLAWHRQRVVLVVAVKRLIEVGLAGEIRPVPSGQERISEAAKHGFRRAIVPAANVPKKVPEGMQIFGVKKLSDALSVFDDL